MVSKWKYLPPLWILQDDRNCWVRMSRINNILTHRNPNPIQVCKVHSPTKAVPIVYTRGVQAHHFFKRSVCVTGIEGFWHQLHVHEDHLLLTMDKCMSSATKNDVEWRKNETGCWSGMPSRWQNIYAILFLDTNTLRWYLFGQGCQGILLRGFV